jgi:antirestriction protein ArdC
MASPKEIREQVTNTVIAALEAHLCPWHMRWSPATNTGLHANVVTKRRYSGVNPLLLQLAALEWGFQSRWWGSFGQWTSLGGQVTGCGTRIVSFKRISRLGRDSNGERATHLLPRERTVFSADQVEGVEQFKVQAPSVEVQPDYEPARRVIAATGADIREVEGDKAWYFYPPNDYIEIPSTFTFILGMGGLCSWYDTIFHELCHWAEPRLGWNGGYALGEMRAEMGAGFLSAALNIPSFGPTNHHFACLDSWIGAMKEDCRAIFRVASAASAAANFILACSEAEQSQDQDAKEVSAQGGASVITDVPDPSSPGPGRQ